MVKRNVTRQASLSSPMASSGFLHLLILTSSLLIILTVSGESHRPCYDSIISFGDSLADTGNLLRFGDLSFVPYFALPPYGETFFHHPTGRFSDGRLIIDFIAEFLGLPFVPPYVGSENKSFEKGINFAVAGATALDVTYFKDKAVKVSILTNVSLGVQLNIFKEMLPRICHSSSDCREFLSRSLILMGEIGGNDYNYPFFLKRNIKEIKHMVPSVINVISSAIKELIEIGGKTFLVPGDFPIGCSTVYLTTYQTTNSEDYDPLTGCLTWLNEFAEYHNELLQTELNRLRKLYPHVNIIYADYYNVLLRLYQEPTKYGFMDRPLSACCGVGGSYNFSSSRHCGYGAPYCEDPSKYVNWDGVHLTEAAYRWIAKGLLKGPYADPPFNLSCFDIKLQSSSQDNHMSLSI